MIKKGGLMVANDFKGVGNGHVFVVDKNCGSIRAMIGILFIANHIFSRQYLCAILLLD